VTTNPGADARTYASDVQHLLARIEPGALDRAKVSLKVTTHADFTSFVKSKAGVDEEPRVVRIEEFVTQRDDAGRPTQVRAKVKTGEALNQHFPAGDGPALAAQRDLTGADVIGVWIARAVDAAGPESKAVAERIVIEPDSMAAAGQDWVPEFTSAWAEDGVVHLQSRSMFIASTHPLPEGFVPPPGVLGVHYVALPAPEFIEAIVSGDAVL